MTSLLEQDLVSVYLADEDKENANKYESYTKLRGFVADKFIKKWAKEHIYSSDVIAAHEEGWIHIHNMGDAVVPYCKGHDATKILVRGLITPTITASPSRHLSSFFDQLVNLIATSQQSWAGAQAIAHINTLAAPFVRKYANWLRKIGLTDEDLIRKLTFKYVKQCVQSFLYNLGFPSRAGSQTPFSNITLNFACPKAMKDEPVLNYGCEGTWGDYEEEALIILEAFNEVYYEGDAAGNPFTFPIPTINLIPETPFEHPLWEKIIKTQIKYGTYSFFNYIGTGIDPNTFWAMCCRVIIDLSLLAPAGGRWAYAGETGSIGVVTLNMSKIGYHCRDNPKKFYDVLDEILSLARRALIMKSVFVDSHKERFMPLDVTYGTNLDRYFRTVGVVGLNEMCVNMFGTPLSENIDFVREVLEYLREWSRKMQLTTKLLWNIEMTPAEGSASSLAEKDKNMYGDNIFTQGIPDAWYYTSMLTPPSQNLSIQERISIEEQLLSLFSGGTIHRIYIGENEPNPKVVAKLIEKIAKKTKITYFDLARIFSICRNAKHYIGGDKEICPECGGETVTWDRIVGYYRPREQANKGKIQEIKDRIHQKL